jgi:hypothetical protein
VRIPAALLPDRNARIDWTGLIRVVWRSPPLADGPIVLDTGIQHEIRLFVSKGLNQPWSMAFLPGR